MMIMMTIMMIIIMIELLPSPIPAGQNNVVGLKGMRTSWSFGWESPTGSERRGSRQFLKTDSSLKFDLFRAVE